MLFQMVRLQPSNILGNQSSNGIQIPFIKPLLLVADQDEILPEWVAEERVRETQENSVIHKSRLIHPKCDPICSDRQNLCPLPL